MGRQIWKAQLKQINALTPTICELVLKPQKDFVFQAGEFVMLQVPQADIAKPVLRAYSIASSALDSKEFRLLIKLVPGGIASEWLRTQKTGVSLDFTGPFGKLHFAEPPTEQVVFLCTGAGLSQHYSFLTTYAQKYSAVKYHMRMGVWNESEIFYEKELLSLQTTVKNFQFQFVLDQSVAGKHTEKYTQGYVTQNLESLQYQKIQTTFYLCGNPAMIKSAKEILAQTGQPAERIFAEAFH